jgi:hypothetical protein
LKALTDAETTDSIEELISCAIRSIKAGSKPRPSEGFLVSRWKRHVCDDIPL